LARAEAMNAFPTVGIGFVVHCPTEIAKQTKQGPL